MNDPLDGYKVHDIQELKKQNKRDEALKLLQTVARQVQPILRKRKWTVPKLREFFPGNPNLLVRLTCHVMLPDLCALHGHRLRVSYGMLSCSCYAAQTL
jgi:WLM domain